MAGQGKLTTKRKIVSKKLSALDSPRKSTAGRPNDSLPDNGSSLGHSIDDGNHSCICSSTNRISYWPSQESHDLDSNYGCGDTASVSENNDSFNDTFNFSK